MGTERPSINLGTALFSKTKRGLLALFFIQPNQSFYVRQIVRTLGIGQGTVQRELARLAAAGLLVRRRIGSQVHYQANTAAPIFTELKSLMVKSAGMADVLREALAGLAEKITLAFIHGSMANGRDRADSDVDVVVVGDVSFNAVVTALHQTQETLGREVNATVYAPEEFAAKLRTGHHFVTSVVTTPKIYLMGGERELKRLGAGRVADRA